MAHKSSLRFSYLHLCDGPVIFQLTIHETRTEQILLIASLASVAAFTPMTPRALTARSAVRAAPQVVPKTALMSSMEDEDDVETSITRGGMIAGVGLPILFAPLAGIKQALGLFSSVLFILSTAVLMHTATN